MKHCEFPLSVCFFLLSPVFLDMRKKKRGDREPTRECGEQQQKLFSPFSRKMCVESFVFFFLSHSTSFFSSSLIFLRSIRPKFDGKSSENYTIFLSTILMFTDNEHDTMPRPRGDYKLCETSDYDTAQTHTQQQQQLSTPSIEQRRKSETTSKFRPPPLHIIFWADSAGASEVAVHTRRHSSPVQPKFTIICPQFKDRKRLEKCPREQKEKSQKKYLYAIREGKK